ncbi:MAG: hypothetical protein ABIR02_08275 [Novosphingobium sp.]
MVELAAYVPDDNPSSAAPLREVRFRANAWLPDEIAKLREMFAGDFGWDEISAEIGRPRGGVIDKAFCLGLRRDSHRPWSEFDDAYVLEHYGTSAAADVAQHLGRSCASVYSRAAILGLTDEQAPPWTPWEDAQLRAGYAQGAPCGQLAVLIGRQLSGLRSRASALGLRHPHQPGEWSDPETTRALALANDGHVYSKIIDLLATEGFPRRSKNGFGQRIRMLGYGRGWGRRWLPEEDELIRQAYATGASLTPLIERLGRSRSAIRWKVKDLGLQGTHVKNAGWRGRIWTETERDFLRANYATMPPKAIGVHLGRGKHAVYYEAWRLGLKTNRCGPLTDEEKRAFHIAFKHNVSIADLAIAINRKALTVSKYATDKAGLYFGRRPRLAKPPTLAEILAMAEPT